MAASFLPIIVRERSLCKRFVFLVNDQVLRNNYLGVGGVEFITRLDRIQ
jgi:hypothetical protein